MKKQKIIEEFKIKLSIENYSEQTIKIISGAICLSFFYYAQRLE